MAVRGVLLDAGGTITFPRLQDVTGVLRRHGHEGGLSALDLHRSFYAAVRTIDERDDPGDGTWWWTTWLGAAGVEEDVVAAAVPELRDGALLWLSALDGAAEAIRQLRAAGLRLAVVSNAFGRVAEELDAIGVADDLDAIVDSHVVGVAKPDARIFAIALDRIGVRPEEAIHVGDVFTIDVKGALAAGVRPVHLDPYGWYDHDHARVASLGELPSLLAT